MLFYISEIFYFTKNLNLINCQKKEKKKNHLMYQECILSI